MSCRVFYDHQIFSLQRTGGISRYFAELLAECRASGVTAEVGVRWTNNQYLLTSMPGAGPLLPANRILEKFKITVQLLRTLNGRAFTPVIKARGYDLFHPTYYHPYFLDLIGKRPFVVTVYDMIHEIFPDAFLPFDRTARFKKLLVDRAARVIAISENTKKDLVRIYSIPSEKIDVVHLAVADQWGVAGGERRLPMLPANYILFVGRRKAYKNFALFFEAVTPLLKQDRELSLVCAGGGDFSSQEGQALDAAGVKAQVVNFPFVPDADLRQIYRQAKAFVFPSLYEGFGIPVLEAFSCGCPLVASAISSLPEIAGEAAAYFDPRSADSIREAVQHVISSEDRRQMMIKCGHERAGLFSWRKTAAATADVYQKVLGGRA